MSDWIDHQPERNGGILPWIINHGGNYPNSGFNVQPYGTEPVPVGQALHLNRIYRYEQIVTHMEHYFKVVPGVRYAVQMTNQPESPILYHVMMSHWLAHCPISRDYRILGIRMDTGQTVDVQVSKLLLPIMLREQKQYLHRGSLVYDTEKPRVHGHVVDRVPPGTYSVVEHLVVRCPDNSTAMISVPNAQVYGFCYMKLIDSPTLAQRNQGEVISGVF